jgi:hypothetical protein
MRTRQLVCVAALVCLSCSPAFAEPILFTVSGTLGDVRTERLTSPDAATSQGLMSGAAITGLLTIDFDLDLSTLIHGDLNSQVPIFSSQLGLPFFAGLEFEVGGVSFTTAARHFETMLINGSANSFSLIFDSPTGAGAPPFLIDQVFLSLATSAPFTWDTFSSIDRRTLELQSWDASLPLGGSNRLAFTGTTNLEVEQVPEPGTLWLAVVGLSVVALSTVFSRRAHLR